MKAWRPWLTMVIKQRKIEREIAATEMSRVVRGFLGRVRAQRVRVHKASIAIQCRGRQYNARRKVQRQRMHRAALRISHLFAKLLKIKRAKQELQRRRCNRAVTRIQVSNTTLDRTLSAYQHTISMPHINTSSQCSQSTLFHTHFDTETFSRGRWSSPFCRM